MNYKSKWYRPLTILACGLMLFGCGKKETRLHVDYMAVQFERGENWSIIDADGKVVVKEEYAPDDRISEIYNGVYWVKSGDSYSLYSVKDPKNPLVDKTWRRTTGFMAGRAAVSNPGDNICIIDESGEEVAKMGNEVRRVYRYTRDGLAVFQESKNGKLGYIDRSGKVAVPALYDQAELFNDGLAIVFVKGDEEKDTKGRATVIDTKGNERGTINLDRYQPLSAFYSEGLLPACYRDAENKSIVYLDESGKEVLKVDKSDCRYANDGRVRCGFYCFVDGYAVFSNKDDRFGIVNKKGETVVRAKYDWLFNLGGGHFCAKKNDKCGLIDKDDNTVLDFDKDEITGVMLGDNYVTKSGRFYRVVSTDGKSALKDEFSDIAITCNEEYAEFIDIRGAVDALAEDITVNGFGKLTHGSTPRDVAQLLGADPREYKSAQYMSGEHDDARLMDFSTNVRYCFYQSPVETKSHVERVSDGWWSYNKTVIDGYEFRDTPLKFIEISVRSRSNEINMEDVHKLFVDKLTAKGFKEDTEESGTVIYTAKAPGCTSKTEDNNKVWVGVNLEGDRMTIYYIYPNAVQTGEYKKSK